MHESVVDDQTGKGNAETGRAVLANRAGPIAQGGDRRSSEARANTDSLDFPIEDSIHVLLPGSRL